MKIHYSEKELSIFNKIAKAADELKMPAYIIGGFVRDKILNRPNKDADIVCIGDGIALAKKTAEKFSPIPTVSFFKNFGTALIKIFSEDTYFEIEIVGATDPCAVMRLPVFDRNVTRLHSNFSEFLNFRFIFFTTQPNMQISSRPP